MKRKLTSLLIALSALFMMKAQAQETQENPLDTLTRSVAAIRSELDVLKRIKLSGYVQSQFQVADSAGISSFAGGDFPATGGSSKSTVNEVRPGSSQYVPGYRPVSDDGSRQEHD